MDRPRSRIVSSMGVLAAIVLALAGGCRKPAPAPAPPATPLPKIAGLYARYATANKGVGPANLDEFKRFIKALPPPTLTSLQIDTSRLDALFISPRDGQPVVILYRQQLASAPLVAYEKTGVEGKRQIIFLNGKVEEADEARLKSLTGPSS